MTENEPKFWITIHTMVTRHRLGVLIVATLLTGIFFARFPDIVPDPNPTAFLPQDIPEVEFWQNLNERFGAVNNLMIGLEEPDGPLTTDGLTRVANITKGLLSLKKEGVVSVRSVINVESTEVDEEGTMNVDDMVPSIPMTQTGLDELAKKIQGNIQIPGAFVSNDLKAYVVMVKLDDSSDQAVLAGKIMSVVEKERGPLSSYYFGAAFATYQVSRRILDGLRWVIPVFAIGLFLVLFIGLRRPAAFLMTLLCAALPLVWWLGVLNMAKIPVTMPVLNGALLLLTFGALAFARAAEGRSRGKEIFFGFRSLLTILVAGAAFGVVAAWLNHVDLSIPFLNGFAKATAIGFIVLAFASIILVMPMMTLFDPAPTKNAPVPVRTAAPISHRVLAIGIPVLITVLSLATIDKFSFAVSLKDMFSPTEDVGRGVDFFDRKLGGNEILQISVKGDFTTSAALNRLMRFSDFLEGSGQFADVRAITQIISYVSSGMTGIYWIPPADDQVADLYFFLEGIEDVKALVSTDRDEAMLAVRMPKDADSRTDELLATVADARKLSAVTGKDAARARLEALASRYEVNLTPEKTAQILSKTESPMTQTDRDAVSARIQKWMMSDSSPWNPSNEEWNRISEVLFGASGEIRDVIIAQPSYLEHYPPDETDDRPPMAEKLAESLEFKVKTAIIEVRSASLTRELASGLQAPDNFSVRARGVLAGLIGPEPEGSQQLEFTISGYPAFTRASENRLLDGLKMASLLLFLTASVYVMLLGLRNPARLVVLPVGAAAATATYALSGWLGINADPNSASVYLVAPLAWIFISETLNDETGQSTRYPAYFALALAAGGASLMMFGVMPVVRMGASLAVSLSLTVIGFAIFRSMWFRQVRD